MTARRFFAADHPLGAKSVSNKGSAALSTATYAAAKASFGAARIALRKLTGRGRPAAGRHALGAGRAPRRWKTRPAD